MFNEIIWLCTSNYFKCPLNLNLINQEKHELPTHFAEYIMRNKHVECWLMPKLAETMAAKCQSRQKNCTVE